MNVDDVRTVQLLLAVALAVFDTAAFAMKGGTALNLVLQDMPQSPMSQARACCVSPAKMASVNRWGNPLGCSLVICV